MRLVQGLILALLLGAGAGAQEPEEEPKKEHPSDALYEKALAYQKKGIWNL